MKKKYSQPDICFESFSLSAAIAGNCEFKTTNPNNSTCGYFMPGFGYAFIDGIQGCRQVIEDEMSLHMNGFCYHVPVENKTLFNS